MISIELSHSLNKLSQTTRVGRSKHNCFSVYHCSLMKCLVPDCVIYFDKYTIHEYLMKIFPLLKTKCCNSEQDFMQFVHYITNVALMLALDNNLFNCLHVVYTFSYVCMILVLPINTLPLQTIVYEVF